MNTILSSNIFNPMSNYWAGDFLKPVWNHFWTYLNPQTHGLSYDLPDETWACIMSELRPYELLKLSTASRKFHSLSSDNSIWNQLAKKQGLFVKPECFFLHEFKLLQTFQENNSKLKYNFASAIGSSQFQLIVEHWNKGGLASKKTALAYFNYGKHVLRVRCKEIASQKEFEMKIIETNDSNFVFINFRNLSQLTMGEPLGAKSRHYKVKSDELLFNYLMRLARGDTCGLFLEGKEELSAAIQLCQ